MRVRKMLEGQGLHALALTVLLVCVSVGTGLPAVRAGTFLGLDTPAWIWAAATAAVLHQVHVAVCWRAELHASLLSRLLGPAGFTVYAAGFATLAFLRVGALWAVAVANAGTLPVDRPLARVAATIALLPSLYLFYSVRRYFGFRRALGKDHFDPAYRHMALVREGIFRWTPNGMYVFGFLLLWAIAFWYASVGAMMLALFNHVYIWVHYHATEKLDIRRIYGA